MKKLISFVVLVVFIVSMTGCAGLTKSKITEVSINSNPEGASVYFDDMRVGKTPLTSIASNKQPLTVTLKKEGYEEVSKRIGVHPVYGYFIVNCFLPPLYGCLWNIIDSGSGNVNSLNETKLNFTLDPITTKK